MCTSVASFLLRGFVVAGRLRARSLQQDSNPSVNQLRNDAGGGATAKGAGAGHAWKQEHRGPSSPPFASPTSAFPPAPALGLGASTCPSPRKASLFILSKSNIPQSRVSGAAGGGGGNTHSGLIAFNESDGAGCQQAEGFAKVRTCP